MSIFSKNKLRLNYFNKLMFILTISIILIAYAVFLNNIFTPSQIPYLNFISIGYPIIFATILLLLAYWLMVSWRHFLILLIISVGTFDTFNLSYPILTFGQDSTSNSNLSVMTFNPHGFRSDGTKELIENNLTDIMLFQEARKHQQKKWKAEKFNGYYSEYYDVLTFHSKYPIIETRKIDVLASENGEIAYADIDLGYDTIRIINIYLEPMYIDKSLVKEVINSDTTEQIEVNSKKIENKLIKGMIIHEKQLKSLEEFFKASPHPILIASDLNSTPRSYEYQQITKYFTDSFLQAGKGNATTFHGFKFPIRIDYLFHSKQFKAIEAKVIRKKFSDHFPVVVQYKLN